MILYSPLTIIFYDSYLYLSGNQHRVEACLYLEDAPPSFGNKLWSQNNDQTSALLNATSQVLNISWEKKGRGGQDEM